MTPAVDPVQQFFSMFAQANAAVWPMQVVWYAAAIASVALAMCSARNANRPIAGMLAAYYVWLGVAFFELFYSAINGDAPVAGAMFVIGGGLFLLAGVIRGDLQFEPRGNAYGVLGGAIMLYALVIYPIIGVMTGHAFPSAPVFGLAPCPSAIFTAGLLLWSRPRMPAYVLVVPLVWLLAQTPSDALAIGVVGDLARPLVGVVATGLLVWRDYPSLRDRLIGAALLAVATLCLGQDVWLMALGGVFLVATLVQWLRHRSGAGLLLQNQGTRV